MKMERYMTDSCTAFILKRKNDQLKREPWLEHEFDYELWPGQRYHYP